MNKKQIIEKLGNCYAPIDSIKGYIELYYRIESPKDTKTKLLEKTICQYITQVINFGMTN